MESRRWHSAGGGSCQMSLPGSVQQHPVRTEWNGTQGAQHRQVNREQTARGGELECLKTERPGDVDREEKYDLLAAGQQRYCPAIAQLSTQNSASRYTVFR